MLKFAKCFLRLFFFVICLSVVLSTHNFCQAALILDGQLLENGEKLNVGQQVNLILRIYDDEFGGKLLFEEQQKVDAGSKNSLFTFEKGNVTVQRRASSLTTDDMWIEVECEGEVMTPRLRLAELGTSVDLEATDWNLVQAGLRTAGTSTLIIGSNGITFADGSQGTGKVLTSDASGLASWQAPAAGSSSPWTESGSDVYRTGGKIGLGTSSPLFMIDVQASAVAPVIGVKATTSSLNAHFVVDRGGNSAQGDIIFKTGGVNKFYTGFEGSNNFWLSASQAALAGIEIEGDGDVNLSKDLNVDGNLNADEIFCNSNLEVSDDLTVGSVTISAGEINQSTTGTSNNLLPFAYGTITSSGGKIGCTSNVGTITKISNGQINVGISNLGSDYTVVITPYGSSAYVSGSVFRRTDDTFNGLIWDVRNDTYYDGGFSFVVYKP